MCHKHKTFFSLTQCFFYFFEFLLFFFFDFFLFLSVPLPENIIASDSSMLYYIILRFFTIFLSLTRPFIFGIVLTSNFFAFDYAHKICIVTRQKNPNEGFFSLFLLVVIVAFYFWNKVFYCSDEICFTLSHSFCGWHLICIWLCD